MRAEVLISKNSHRALGILRSMLDAAGESGVDAVETSRYSGDASRVLLLWGAGRRDNADAWRRHRLGGGCCVGFDLGYWGRSRAEGAVRLHINSRHPTQEQIASTPPFPRACCPTFVLREDSDPDGPILLVGLGNKSRAERGEQPEAWERAAFAALRQEFPSRKIEWRPKYRTERLVDAELPLAPDVPIDEALRGRSLVVCAHSNVALDACVAGLPVRCSDGIARTLYGKNESPSRAERLALLHRASWWNWHPSEAADIWKFIGRMVCG